MTWADAAGLRPRTYLVVLRKDLVAREEGATAAPEPRARYARLTLAFCKLLLDGLAACGSWVEAFAAVVAEAVIAHD